jgi:hypothetical protein
VFTHFPHQLHHMFSLTPLTAPCNETCNHLACWQPRCVWPAKVSFSLMARRQEGDDALVYVALQDSALVVWTDSIATARYLKMGLSCLSHAHPRPVDSTRCFVCSITACGHTNVLAHIKCTPNSLQWTSILISNTRHNIDHQRNHPCDAQNVIASPHLHPIVFSTTHITQKPPRNPFILAKSSPTMIGQKPRAKPAFRCAPTRPLQNIIRVSTS